jgi:hypothetical protein
LTDERETGDVGQTEQVEASESRVWLSLPNVSGVDGLHLECEPRDGRLVVVGLYVHGREVTPTVVHQLPLARIAATHLYPEMVAGELQPPPPPWQWSRATPDMTTGDLRAVAAKLREQRPGRRRVTRRSVTRLSKLREDGLTDSFFAELASVYRSAAAESRAPAKVIADELGVPVKRVHRWVREARLAGALPPARKGAVG